jgi:hypothetical protein
MFKVEEYAYKLQANTEEYYLFPPEDDILLSKYAGLTVLLN